MTDKGQSSSGTTSAAKRRWRLLARCARVLNSGFVIALISSIVVLVLTQHYEASQARSADLVKRRSDLERLLVELELRKDRLQVVCLQAAAGLKDFKSNQLTSIGHRAKAIVEGSPNTVTSDPAFQNFHLATLLSQAEVTAGLPLTHRPDLMRFTDLTDEDALNGTSGVFNLIKGPIETLERELNAGRIPIPQTEQAPRTAVSAGGATVAANDAACSA